MSPPPVKVERRVKEEEEPLPAPAKVDRKRKVKEEEQPTPKPPPPAKLERKEEVKEEKPPSPAKVERKVKEEDSTPTSKVKAGGDGSSYINIKVNNYMTFEDVFIRMNRYSKMQRLMDLYCDRQSVDLHSFTFLEGGRRICGSETPDEIGLEDGDEIVALLHQSGS
ncbi:unnamed protein product [Urochloa humidicola]